MYFISSSIIKEPGDGLIISSSLRSAMSSMLKSYSIEKASKGITTINIAPGPFKTGRVKELVKNLKVLKKPTNKKIGNPKKLVNLLNLLLKKKLNIFQAQLSILMET